MIKEKYSEAKSVAERHLDDSAPKIQATPPGDDSGEWEDFPVEACKKIPSCLTRCPTWASYKLIRLDGKKISGFQDYHSSKISFKNIYIYILN
jgi:hypothetical protein